MSYNSKYKGSEVEALLDKVNNIDDSPSLTEEDIANMGFTKNKGTVTGIKVNGAANSPNSNGIVDLGNISGGGGGEVSVDGYIPLSRDFNDDFNDDFAR